MSWAAMSESSLGAEATNNRADRGFPGPLLICDLRAGGSLTADGEVIVQDGRFAL